MSKNPPTGFKQIAANEYGLYALDDRGYVWEYQRDYHGAGRDCWVQLADDQES